MYKNKKVGVIGIILTILFLVILVFASNGNTGKVSFLENLLNGIVMPVQTGITYLKNKITNNDTYFMDMETIKAENEELKTKNEISIDTKFYLSTKVFMHTSHYDSLIANYMKKQAGMLCTWYQKP